MSPIHINAPRMVAGLMCPLLLMALVAALVFATNVISTSSVGCTDVQVDLFRQRWLPCVHLNNTNSTDVHASTCPNRMCLTVDFINTLPDCHIGMAPSLRDSVLALRDSCQTSKQLPSASCQPNDWTKLHAVDSNGVCACGFTNDGCLNTSRRTLDIDGYCGNPGCALSMIRVVNQQPICTQAEMSVALAMCVNADTDAATRVYSSDVEDITTGNASVLPKSGQQRRKIDSIGVGPLIGIVAVAAVLAVWLGTRYEGQRRERARSVASTESTSSEASLLEEASVV